MKVPRRRFGRTGLEVPAVNFGGGWVGGLLIHGDEAARDEALRRAMAAGIDWIDTAALYGDGVSETVIGGWLRGLDPAERPRISTKFNVDMAAGDLEAQVFGSLEASFERLGVSHVPLIYLHNQILADDNAATEGRNVRIGELLAPGGPADLLDKVRSQGLCDWVGITGLGDPAPPAPGGRQRPLRRDPGLLQPAEPDGGAGRRGRLELLGLRRPAAGPAGRRTWA